MVGHLVAIEADPARFDLATSPVAGIVAACREADGRSPLDEAALLRLRHHGLAGARLLTVPDGFALLRDEQQVALDLAVGPAARGRGAGSVLLEAALTTYPGRGVVAWAHGDHPAAAALAGSHGFGPVRELWVMRRSLAGLPEPDAPPAGVRLTTYLAARDEQDLLAVNAAAFAHHPEQGSMSAADLRERQAEPWFDPAGLFLARDRDGTLLGFHWTKRHDARTGEVYVVGIAPAAQGRGLGRLLTLTGLRHLAEVGATDVHLFVEADNAAALTTYSRLGFGHAPRDTDVRYLRRPDRAAG